MKQVLSDLEQNILKYEKFGDDDSGGDDSDYSNENKKEEKKEEKDSKGQNQIVIKRKINPNVIPANKKKK